MLVNTLYPGALAAIAFSAGWLTWAGESGSP